MSKYNKMNTKQSPYITLLILTVKCCISVSVALYLALLGVSIFQGVKVGVFTFNFYNEFIFSVKKGAFFGVIYGLGEWLIKKSKDSGKNKNN